MQGQIKGTCKAHACQAIGTVNVHSVCSASAGADPGGGHGGPMPPPSGLSPRKTPRFATRLAHVATLTQCTSLYESLLHVLHT